MASPKGVNVMAQLDLLLQSGADKNVQDKYGRTALSYATEFRDAKAKARLIYGSKPGRVTPKPN